MTPITHALFPILAGSRWIRRHDHRPSLRISAVVALCGALPDLLDPHITLDARFESWSHTLLAAVGFSVVVIAVCSLKRFRAYSAIGVLCVFAYAAHLACDVISGGGRLLLPFSHVISGGSYWPSWAWGATDILLLLYVYLAYRWIPLRKRYLQNRTLSAQPAAPRRPTPPVNS